MLIQQLLLLTFVLLASTGLEPICKSIRCCLDICLFLKLISQFLCCKMTQINTGQLLKYDNCTLQVLRALSPFLFQLFFSPGSRRFGWHAASPLPTVLSGCSSHLADVALAVSLQTASPAPPVLPPSSSSAWRGERGDGGRQGSRTASHAALRCANVGQQGENLVFALHPWQERRQRLSGAAGCREQLLTAGQLKKALECQKAEEIN